MEPTSTSGARERDANTDVLYSIFSQRKKVMIVCTASFAAFLSPLSSNVYYPALSPISEALHTSETLINLSITMYLIFQGLAPTLIGSFSDVAGRRPAYLISMAIYSAANVGLALQKNYAALLVLRCLQSSGSSGTSALGNAVISDISSSEERGTYVAWGSAGAMVGPALGPIIGGVLSQYLGWRAIFWFLTILGGTSLLALACFFPETCRLVVGNGSLTPTGWNLSLWEYFHQQKKIAKENGSIPNPRPGIVVSRRPSPMAVVRILLHKESSLILFYSGILFAGYYMVVSTIPVLFQDQFGLTEFQVGLCYLPTGTGSMLAAFTQGHLVDWNFRRHALKSGYEIVKGRQQALVNFPLEAARLQVALPFVYFACAATLTYGWVMHLNPPLFAPLIVLFFIGYSVSGSFNIMSTLIIDLHPTKPGTASAANNLVRCLLGAGVTAMAIPLLNQIGSGWTYTFVAITWCVSSLSLWIVLKYGPQWRLGSEGKERH